MLKIAITGKANSGKNTVSKLLSEKICQDKQEPVYLAFADPIKEIARTLFPHIPHEHLYGASKYRSEAVVDAFKDGKPLTVRQLLIDIGTMGRLYNPNIWIDVLRGRLKVAQEKHPPLIIFNDVRFKNEFYFLQNQKFCQIRLYRDEHTKINHESETDQDGLRDSQFDYILHNDGSLQDLQKSVERIATFLLP